MASHHLVERGKKILCFFALLIPLLYLQGQYSAYAQSGAGAAAEKQFKSTVKDLKNTAERQADQALAGEAEDQELQAEVKAERRIWGQALLIEWALRLMKAFIMILVGIGLYKFLTFGIRKLEANISQKDAIRESDATLRLKTLSGLAYWLGTIAIWIGIIYIVLENFGFNVTPLLAGAGIIGLAFGFGGQYLIRDVINGVFILLEGQYHVGDVVKIGDLGGLVEKVNLRITQLRDLEGRAIFIPNGEIKAVINMTKEWSRAVFDIGVAYKEDVDKVIEVIKELGKEIRQDPAFGRLILNDLEMLGVDAFGDSQVTIKFMIKTLPIKQWDVAREFRRRLKIRFDELGIEIPFPHRTVYWGAGEHDKMREYLGSGEGRSNQTPPSAKA